YLILRPNSVRTGRSPLLYIGYAVHIRLGCLDNSLATTINEEMPNRAAARTSEQPQLAVTDIITQELKHLLGVCRGKPFLLGHGRLLTSSQESSLLPNIL